MYGIGRIFALIACCLAFQAPAAEKVPYSIVIRDGHGDALYRIGEEAVFELSVSGRIDRAALPGGAVDVRMDRFGGPAMKKIVWDPIQQPRLTVRGTLDHPGFLRVTAVTKPADQWAIGEGNACWSVGYEPEKITGSTPYPGDFASYWKGELARLARDVSVDFQRTPVESQSKGTHDAWKVSVATFGGRRIWGFLIEPKSRGNRKLPLVMRIAGAGSAYAAVHVAGFRNSDEATLIMNVHYYEPQEKVKEQDALYSRLNEDYRRKYGPGINYSVAGASESREAFYFHDAIVGLVRLSSVVADLPEIDRAKIWYQGGSQGSGIGLAVTALNPRICRAYFRVPALSDLCGFKEGRQSGWPLLAERQPDTEGKRMAEWVAQYFDAVNFARLVRVPVRIVVGFADNCCPPYGGYSIFNALPVRDKGIANGIGMWHVTDSRFDRLYENTWLRTGVEPLEGLLKNKEN